jgi:hypothetical protein
VQEQPDARALIGLAQVSHANGQPEAVITFASEALQLEPGNAAAKALLARHQPAAVAA